VTILCLNPARRFARYVASERFAPQGAPAHLASPTYIVLLDRTAASLSAAATVAAGGDAAAVGGGAMQPLPTIEEVLLFAMLLWCTSDRSRLLGSRHWECVETEYCRLPCPYNAMLPWQLWALRGHSRHRDKLHHGTSVPGACGLSWYLLLYPAELRCFQCPDAAALRHA
jgi:hypothetical protein